MQNLRLFFVVCVLSVAPFIQAQQNKVDSLVDVAVGWRESGNAELALRELDALAASKNAGERILYEQALTLLELNRYSLAIAPAKRAVAMKGNFRVDASLILTQCFVARGEYKRAQRMLNTLRDDALQDERIPYHYAALYLKMGDLDKAESEVQKAILLNRSFIDAHLLLSNIMIDKGARLKAMLPLYYYLLYNSNHDDDVQAVQQLCSIWKSSSGRMIDYLRKPIIANDLYGDAERQIKTISTNDSISTAEGVEAIKILLRSTCRLFEFLKMKSGDNFDFYQLVYLDFFIELHTKGYVEPFVYFISDGQWHAQVLEWIAGNGQKFNEFRVWMESR